MKRIWPVLLLLGALGACSKSAVDNPLTLIPVNERTFATEISADWIGTTDSPTLQNRKGKVVIVNFWATWCGPCRMEMPGLVKIYQRYHDKGMDIFGLSVDQPNSRGGSPEETRKYVKEFAASNNVPYPIGLANPSSSQAYGISAIPASFLVDKQGRLALRLIGLYPEDKIADAVDRLLKE